VDLTSTPEAGEPEPLDDLGLKACPNCLEPMLPAGSARELLVADRTGVTGSAYWGCLACGMTAVA
jgi:hypothetical protein